MTHNEVAESIGRSRTTVTNILRLLTLTREVKVMVNSGFLEMGHARALLGLPEMHQSEAAELVIHKSLSVRETEKLVQRMSTGKNKKEINIKQEFQAKAANWNTLLAKKFSSNVNVNLNSNGKGKVVFQFESIEEAERLVDHLLDTD
jgi:ParB family chromosome partitioning protein